MEKLVPLFNQLQEILSKANLNNSIQIPQIVAVGAQSTGKSSVLESIIGKDLLPRGSGIVTRRPIILQLNNTLKSEEYVEFSHKKGEKFTDFHSARKELEDEMARIAGENKGISSDPIILKMFSPTIVNLTIVDLPGITKIPVGDQPQDIEKRVYEMIMSYIKNPNTIILAVTPANVDLANSDSLKLAREVDPEGNRTLGVITKLDLMEENTHCLDALEGNLYKLKLGYVGVVGRSQKELENRKSVQEAIESEKAFFKNHKVYGKFSERMGIDYLTKELSTTFLKSIKKTLPSISESLHHLMQDIESEMRRNGDEELDPESKDSQGQLVLSLMSKFARVYSEIIAGNYANGTTKELFGGARVNYILYDLFNKSVDEIDPFKSLTDERIRVAIRNANGIDPCLFLPESAFENLVRQQILRLKQPCLECAFLVHEELRKVLHSIEIPGLSRFKILHSEIHKTLESVLQKCYLATKDMIVDLINIELGHINTNHPDFVGGINMLLNLAQSKENAQEQQNWTFEELGKMILEKVQPEKEEERIREINLDDLTDDSDEEASLPINMKPQLRDEAFEESMKNYEKLNIEERIKTENNHQDSSILGKGVSFQTKQKTIQPVQGSLYNLYHLSEFNTLKLPQVPNKLKLEEEPTEKEKIEINMIKKLVISYFNVVKKNIDDSVIKAIITFLINKVKNECDQVLVKNLYKEDLFEKLLVEDLYTMEERKARREKMIFLRRCANIISEMEFKL